MQLKAYLAGPDVFLPNAPEHAKKKVDICARFKIEGMPPLNEDVASIQKLTERDAWRAIYKKDVSMMETADLIIANLTPFGGASADAGTLVELGWFLGKGKPAFGYTNSAEAFESRTQKIASVLNQAHAEIHSFGLADNLMIAGALETLGGFGIIGPSDSRTRPLDALDIFEHCVQLAAKSLHNPHGNRLRTIPRIAFGK